MYQCLASDWDIKVEKKIQSIIRQVNKYGFSADYKEISREIKEVPFYRIDSNVKVKLGTMPVQVVNYEFNMPDFKVGDYTPVAVIEHDVVINVDNVNNLVHLINGFENAPKEWWTIAGHCDDCNDNYSRKKTVMLLNNEDGSYRQIGTSCLKRYLGITCFNVIHNFMLVEELVEEELAIYGDDYSFSKKKYVKTVDLLSYVYTMYDTMGGYIKNITLEKAWQAAISSADISESALKRARNTIEFFKNLNNEDLNDFAYSVQTAVLSEYTEGSGYIAYAPLLQEKLIAKQTEHKEAMSSNYVGNIKDKITVDVIVTSCTGFDGQYGYMFVNTFQDVNKNIFVWITGTKSYEIGTKLKLMGTVKAHNEYNGVKQTVLTRVKEL